MLAGEAARHKFLYNYPRPPGACAQHLDARRSSTTMSVSVFSRHPRYALLLTSILLVSVYILFPSSATPIPRPGEYLRSAKSLRSVLHEEDRRYDLDLEAREDLVRKWGPTAQDVVSCVCNMLEHVTEIDTTHSFPEKGDFYTLCKSLHRVIYISLIRFQGTFSRPPSAARTASNVSAHLAMAASGSAGLSG